MKKRILIIEDEKEMNYRSIEKLEAEYGNGHDIEFARSIDGAYNLLELSRERGETFDLVILDVMMSPGRHYSNEETDDGIETGWVFYERELKDSSAKIVVWTRNRAIFDKTWGDNVAEKLAKNGEDDQLVNAIKKHLGL